MRKKKKGALLLDLTQYDLSGSLPIIRHNGLPDAGILGFLAIVSPKPQALGDSSTE